MWVLELLFSGSGSGLISDWLQSYLEKHPKTGYIKAFFIGFGCTAIPFEICIIIAASYKGKSLLEDLLVGSAISGCIGLGFGFLTMISLFFIKRSIAKKAKSQ